MSFRAQSTTPGVVAVDGPGRLVGEDAPAVDQHGQVGEAVLDRLERSDRHAELLPGHHVVDTQPEGGVGDADEGGRGEHLPAVEHGLEPGGRPQHPALARSGRAVGERGRPVVAGRDHRRLGAHDHQVVAVDAHDHVGHGTGGHEAPHALGISRTHGDRGDGFPRHQVGVVEDTEGGEVVDQGHRGDRPAHGLGHDHEVGHRRPTAAGRLGRTHAGSTELDQLVPQNPVEAQRLRGPRHRGRALLGEEAVEQLGDRLLIGAQPQVDRHRCLTSPRCIGVVSSARGHARPAPLSPVRFSRGEPGDDGRRRRTRSTRPRPAPWPTGSRPCRRASAGRRRRR